MSESKLRFKDRITMARKAFWAGRRATVLYSSSTPYSMIHSNDEQFISEGYARNDDLYSVIDYIVTLAAGIKPKLIRKKSDGSEEDIYEHPFLDLLQKPQPNVNYNMFIQQAIGFRLITGNAYIYAPILKSGVNKGRAITLFVLPSQFVTPEKVSKNFFDSEMVYKFRWQGKEMKFEDTEIGHFRSRNLDFTQDDGLRGMSALKAGALRLASSNQALITKLSKFHNQGSEGVIGTKTKDVGVEFIADMEAKYQEKYGGSHNAGKMMWTNHDVTYQRFGLSPADLQVLKSMELDLQAFARMYRIDPKLIDPNTPSAYASNMKEAKGSAYTMSVIPVVNELYSVLNEWLLPAYGDDLLIKPDLSKIPELQKDLETMSKTLANIKWAISINEARSFLDLDDYDDPEADIPQGLLDDPGFNMNQSIE